MVSKIIWAPRALADLRDIVAYIRPHNPGAAQRFGEQLIETAESLGRFPERGRVIRKFNDPAIREVFLGSYQIAYRVHSDQGLVEIARIWHGARSDENLIL